MFTGSLHNLWNTEILKAQNFLVKKNVVNLITDVESAHKRNHLWLF